MSGRHDSGRKVGPTKTDVLTTMFYGLLPFTLLLLGSAPVWAAVPVGLASAAIDFWRM